MANRDSDLIKSQNKYRRQITKEKYLLHSSSSYQGGSCISLSVSCSQMPFFRRLSTYFLASV